MSSQVQKLPLGHVTWPQGQGHNSHNIHFTAALKKCGFCSGSELQKWVFLLESSPATLTLLCHKTLVQYPLIQSQLNSKLTHWVTNILRGSVTIYEIEIVFKIISMPIPFPPQKKIEAQNHFNSTHIYGAPCVQGSKQAFSCTVFLFNLHTPQQVGFLLFQ